MQGHKSETTLEPQGILLGLTEFKQYSFLHSNKLLIIQCTDVHCFDTIKGTGIRHFNSPSMPNTVIPRNQGIFFFSQTRAQKQSSTISFYPTNGRIMDFCCLICITQVSLDKVCILNSQKCCIIHRLHQHVFSSPFPFLLEYSLYNDLMKSQSQFQQ